MSVIDNERVKLTATWVNAIAAAAVVTGVIAPLTAVMLGVQVFGAVSGRTFTIAATIWFLFGLALHLVARHVLGRLQE
jgi:hypothetical protein